MTQADSVHSTPPLNTFALTPIAGLDWLDIKPEASPADIFRAIGRLRREARDEIERLIRFLDETDDHMEREPGGDELDASYPESGAKVTNPMEDDEEDDAGEDDGTGEPSLGFLERHCSVYGGFDGPNPSGNQEHLCQGHGGDREDEHDGAEPDEDGEPSLGWGIEWRKGQCQRFRLGAGQLRPRERRAVADRVQRRRGMNPIVRLAPSLHQQSDLADLAAIEDFATLLVILLAQPDADTAIQQMHRVDGLIVCHARAIQSRQR